MIRLVIVAITVIGFLILSIPILFVEWIIGKFSPRTKEISSLRIIQAVFKFILWEAGTKVTIIGEENVPKDTPVLYIGNHRSYFDIVLSYSRCPIRTGYIAKKEMERYPLLSNWMRYLHCLFLDRKDIKQGLKTILTAIEKIKSGISICIFPEGTRNKNKDELELLPFHEGSFKIASVRFSFSFYFNLTEEDFYAFIIVAITVIGFLILSIPILFIEWIIGKFSPRTKDSSLRLIPGVFKLILSDDHR